MYESSNLATYIAAGEPVYDTFFVSVTHDGECQLFAMRSPRDQEAVCRKFGEFGMDAETVKHRDAFMMIRGGTRAFYHMGDVPADQVWAPLTLNKGHAVAA